MRILVTGGAGYIGSHTAKRMARAGHEPIVVDNLSTGRRELARFGQLVRGDVGDRPLLDRVLGQHRIEAIVHFAASAYVGPSLREPGAYFENNVVQTLRLLEAAREAGVGLFVFSSSCTIYGEPARVPVTETCPERPINPYGESKLFIERALSWYGRAHGLRWMALRYFNAAGADPESDLGEVHDPEPHLIPNVLAAAAGERDGVEVFGLDYPTADGSAIRDYVHVCDLADAHLAALDALAQGAPSGPVNLGTGDGASVLDIIHTVERVTGRPVRFTPRPRRPGDAPAVTADARLAATRLGWRPTLSSLEHIVETAWRWHTGAERARLAAEHPLPVAPLRSARG